MKLGGTKSAFPPLMLTYLLKPNEQQPVCNLNSTLNKTLSTKETIHIMLTILFLSGEPDYKVLWFAQTHPGKEHGILPTFIVFVFAF